LAERQRSPVTAPPIDRTPKLYIGGKQTRPDGGEVGQGNRKDIRNAVEAARAALPGWSATTGYNRAQILYYIAENLSARSAEFAERVGDGEVERAIESLFTWAAYADKFEGSVHQAPIRGAALAVPEPIGVVGVACAIGQPLLGFINLVGPLVAMGNTVVAIPSELHPLSATDLYQVLDTSDVPPGVINIVTGARDPLIQVLADHDDVDAVWYVGTPEGLRTVEAASVGNMKRTCCWLEAEFAVESVGSDELLREAVQIKNIWIPWGA